MYCAERKYLLCYKPKDHLSEEKKKKTESFYIQSTMCFKSQNFLANLKLPLWVILTLSAKKKVVLPFKLTIFFIWQHEPISLVKLHYKIGNHFYPLPWNLDFSPPEKKKKIKKYIYIALVSFQSTGNILQPKWCLRGKNCKRRYVTNTSYF